MNKKNLSIHFNTERHFDNSSFSLPVTDSAVMESPKYDPGMRA